MYADGIPEFEGTRLLVILDSRRLRYLLPRGVDHIVVRTRMPLLDRCYRHGMIEKERKPGIQRIKRGVIYSN